VSDKDPSPQNETREAKPVRHVCKQCGQAMTAVPKSDARSEYTPYRCDGCGILDWVLALPQAHPRR
jgi:predicted RNA-binding Zn-ribbon protein involved in translation (DUF1610 family)